MVVYIIIDIEEPVTYDTIIASNGAYVSVDGSDSEMNITKSTAQPTGMSSAASQT